MRTASLLVSFLLWAAAVAAQTPLGPEFIPASTAIDATEQFGGSVACDQASVCALVWSSYDSDSGYTAQWARTVSASGAPSGIQLLWANPNVPTLSPIAVLDQGFALFAAPLDRTANSVQLNLRILDEGLHPLTGLVPVTVSANVAGLGSPAVISGGFVELVGLFPGPGLALVFFDRNGKELRSPVVVIDNTSVLASAALALDRAGDMDVVLSHLDASGQLQVYVRRFAPSGDPLGPETKVSDGLSGLQYESSVAAAPDGQLFVVWLSKSDPNADFGEIWGRLFGADGEPSTQPFRVSHNLPAQAAPLAVADPYGNYFVTWDSYENGTYDVRGRLCRHDGRPVTRDDVVVNQDRSFDQLVVSASFAPNGTLTVSYETNDPAVTGSEASLPVVRRYSASPGQEICAISGSKTECDLGRTGGFPELQLTWGGHHGEVTLFGDIDGDGRDDVCSYLNGQFVCDVSHEGKTPYWRESFGFQGEIPLLGDVDGDGRADPCVWRKRSVLVCDTKHDGTENYRLQVGTQHGTPLLGDMDGDGKADLCVVNGSSWSCLLSSTSELKHLTFGKGGSPALGDVNGDSKADPCILRKGRLTCDTKHEGGAGDYTLQLDVPSGARLLFGNLDGL